MKKSMYFILIAVLFSVATLTGCKSDEEKAAEALTENLQKSMEKIGEMNNSGSANSATPGVAVPAKTLATFLPNPSGYTLTGEPETVDMEMQGTKYSSVTAEYTNGTKRVKVGIFDYNHIAGLSMGFAALMNINMETNEEITRSQEIASYPGWFNWHKKDNDGTIGVVVNDRIFVTTEAREGLTQDELIAIASSINYDGIASASK